MNRIIILLLVVAAPLSALAKAHPDLSIGCYPFQLKSGAYGANVVIRGADAQAVETAARQLDQTLQV